MPPIHIEPHEWEELSAILQKHLPGRKVWAFGSRATGRQLKRFSDLDLAIEGPELPLEILARVTEDLEESRLPFKVDILELASITPEFRTALDPDKILLQQE